jgi:hypothetical protein
MEEISDESRFEKLLELPYSEMASFVMSRMRNRTFPMLLFWFASILTLALSVAQFFSMLDRTATTAIFGHIFLGFVVFPILLIPVHETLHILPLLVAGAKNIRVGTDIKQFMFYVTAHKEVINRREFTLIALLPFIVITLALIALIIFLPGIWKFSISSLLFVHTTVCVGDFGLIDFYREQGNREIYTWDDVDQKIAYFIVDKYENDIIV